MKLHGRPGLVTFVRTTEKHTMQMMFKQWMNSTCSTCIHVEGEIQVNSINHSEILQVLIWIDGI